MIISDDNTYEHPQLPSTEHQLDTRQPIGIKDIVTFAVLSTLCMCWLYGLYTFLTN